MTQLHLARWSGQFRSAKVVQVIRRTIEGRIAAGECLVVYDGEAKGLDEVTRKKIRAGWPSSKVRFSVLPRQEEDLL